MFLDLGLGLGMVWFGLVWLDAMDGGSWLYRLLSWLGICVVVNNRSRYRVNENSKGHFVACRILYLLPYFVMFPPSYSSESAVQAWEEVGCKYSQKFHCVHVASDMP